LNDAKEITAKSYRTKPPGPLVGKEALLLTAFEKAKSVHDSVLSEEAERRDLLAGRNAVLEFSAAVSTAREKWNALSADEQEWVSNLSGVNTLHGAALFSPEDIGRVFDGVQTAADTINDFGEARGRPPEARALQAFIRVLGEFWTTHVTAEKFYWDFKSGAPISTSSKFVVEAAKCLGRGYTANSCSYAWKVS
jgi:hypothetical protein